MLTNAEWGRAGQRVGSPRSANLYLDIRLLGLLRQVAGRDVTRSHAAQPAPLIWSTPIWQSSHNPFGDSFFCPHPSFIRTPVEQLENPIAKVYEGGRKHHVHEQQCSDIITRMRWEGEWVGTQLELHSRPHSVGEEAGTRS